MIQLKVLGEGLNLWHKKPGAYWIKVWPQHTCWRIVPIWKKVTPLARQEQSRSLEELRERAWSLPWPIVEAAALLENKVGSKFTGKKKTSTVDWMWFQAKRRVQGDFGIEFCGGEHSFLLFEVQLCNLHLVFASLHCILTLLLESNCRTCLLTFIGKQWVQASLLVSSAQAFSSLTPSSTPLVRLRYQSPVPSEHLMLSCQKHLWLSSCCVQATTTGFVGIWLPHCSPIANIWLSRL